MWKSSIDLAILVACILFYLSAVNSEPQVTGRCGTPGTPPNAKKDAIAQERVSFPNGEEVKILCKSDEYELPLGYKLKCNNSRWVGRNKPRCGNHDNFCLESRR